MSWFFDTVCIVVIIIIVIDKLIIPGNTWYIFIQSCQFLFRSRWRDNFRTIFSRTIGSIRLSLLACSRLFICLGLFSLIRCWFTLYPSINSSCLCFLYFSVWYGSFDFLNICRIWRCLYYLSVYILCKDWKNEVEYKYLYNLILR